MTLGSWPLTGSVSKIPLESVYSQDYTVDTMISGIYRMYNSINIYKLHGNIFNFEMGFPTSQVPENNRFDW